MIERPVVLVLGAGASKPYGFPLGHDLVDWAKGADALDQLNEALWKGDPAGAGALRISQFLKRFEKFDPTSIDAFLETHPQFRPEGRAIIAYYLVSAEDPDRVKGDWYQHFAHEIMFPDGGYESPGDNNLTIITYNYDRSLEFFLLTVLESPKKVRSIDIIHLHGKLGVLPELVENPGDPDECARDYHNSTERKFVIPAAADIKIMDDADPGKDSDFADARAALKKAKNVVFLGFGYHRKNIERLRLDEYRDPKKTLYWGTAVDLSPSRCRQIDALFPKQGGGRSNITLDQESPNVLEYIKNHLSLFA